MKEIKLEEVLFKKLRQLREKHPKENYYTDEMIRKSPEYEYFIGAMKDACKQVLELAAENANMIGETQHNNGAPDVYKDFVYVVDDNGPDYGYVVNKQSILDVINKVK